MTQPFASAHVSAELDWNNLDAELLAKVTAAAIKASKAAQRELNKIKFTPNVDTTRLRQDLREIKNLKVDVGLRINASEVRKFVAELNERFKTGRRPMLHVIPVLDEDVLRARLASLPEGRIKVGLSVSTAEVRRFASELRMQLATANIRVPVGLDLQGEAAFRARLDALTRDRTTRVNINSSGGGGGLGGGGGRNQSSAFRGLKIAGITALVAAIGGAAGTALGAVGALAGGLAALGPAALAGASTAAVGLSGIADAFSAFSDQTASAGTNAQAQAKAIESATRGVEQAEKSVARAKKDSQDAEEDLTRARKDAMNQIEDLNIALRGASLSEKDALLSIREARRDLATGKFDNPDERARAVLRVEEAEQRLLEVQARNKDLAEETYDANVKGVEGSDQVVDAKQRVIDANDAVKESERDLIDAVKELTEAQSPAAGGIDKVAEALAKLSPNARSFVLAMRDLGPAWKDLRMGVQDVMFADLDTVFTDLAKTYLPTLKAGMTDVAGAMNGAAKDFAAFWESAEAQEGLRAMFAGTSTLITAIQPGLAQATTGFLSMAKAAEPAMANVGKGLGDLLGGIGQAFTDAFENGSLTALISTFGDILSGLGGGLNSLLDGFIEIGNYVGPTIGPLFQSLGDLIKNIAPAMGVLGASFSVSLQMLMLALTEFINALAVGLTPIMPVLADLLSALGDALRPLIPYLSEMLQILGGALITAIQGLAPSLPVIGEAFVNIFKALEPLIAPLSQIAGTLLTTIATNISSLAVALTPVIQAFADGLMPMLPMFSDLMAELTPLFAEMAETVGTALLQAVEQLMPFLPQLFEAMTQVWLTTLPLLPVFTDLAVKILPVFMEIIVALLPSLIEFINVLVEIANAVIIPVLIPAVELLGRMIDFTFNAVMKPAINSFTDQMAGARDFLGGAADSIVGFFTGMGDRIKSVWDTIVSTIKFAVGEIGKFLMRIPEVKIPDLPGIPGRGTTIGFSDIGSSMVQWATSAPAQGMTGTGNAVKTTSTSAPGFALGGVFSGRGGPTDDANVIRISDKEHLAYITKAQAVSGRTLPLLEAINNGWVPSPEFLRGMVGGIPGYATGGLVSAEQVNQFPRMAGLEGDEYVWGGVNWGDCSGAMSALANYATGRDPFGSRFATGNMAEKLAEMGAVPGLGPAGSLSFGWYNGGPYGGHTAGTLPDGTNVEMGGARGDGQVGGGAAGADDSAFTDHAHFPPEFFVGGDQLPGLSAPSGGGGSTPTDSGMYSGGGGGGADLSGPSTAAYDPAAVRSATTGYSLPNTGGDLGGGGDPYSIGTGSWAERIDAGNRWAADQNFGTQAEKWGYDALGSIAGDLASPLGLGGLASGQVNSAYEAMMAQRAEANSYGSGDGKLADTMVFQNMDERRASEEMRRMLEDRTTPATVTTRNGG